VRVCEEFIYKNNMKKSIKIALWAILASCVMPSFAVENLPDKADVVSLMERVNTSWQTRKANGKYIWNVAVYHNGNMAVVEYLKDIHPDKSAQFRKYSLAWAKKNNWKGATADDKTTWRSDGGGGSASVLFGDNQICFQTYIDLYNSYNVATDLAYINVDNNGDGNMDKEDMVARAKTVMDYQIVTPSPNKGYYWWWTDALFMVMPVMSRMYALEGDNGNFTAACLKYFTECRTHMYDESGHLFFRDPSFIYPKNQTSNGKPNYWSRAVGWSLAGMTRYLDGIPVTDASYNYILQVFKDECAELVKWQQVDSAQNGYWTQSVEDPDYVTGYETSGTELDLCAMLWGLRKGYLDEKTYWPVCQRAWNYLTKVALRDGDTSAPYVGYVQPQGAAAGHPIAATSEQDFGTGAYLLACVAMAQYIDYVNSKSTSIRHHRAEVDQNGDVYTIGGKLVGHNQTTGQVRKKLPKGVYVVSGKKWMVS
jgi:rhamnogalacturonyl hydrolase YesR